jgi:hypothetical protein
VDGVASSENDMMQHICRKLGFALSYDTSEEAFEAEFELRRHG